jgi:TetR/AcrR family transcriptional repressor of bet genes
MVVQFLQSRAIFAKPGRTCDTSPMSRIRDIRNDELTSAAIRAVHQHGYAQVTMTDIAQEANASAASINYYFGTKEKLMEATMRRLLRVLRHATVEGLAQARNPRARLEAVVAANFDDRLFVPAQCSLWVQFWSNAPYSRSLARLQRINRGRVQRHLQAELRHLVEASEVSSVTATLQAYMDGVWLEAAQSGVCDAHAARREAAVVLARLVQLTP